MKDIFKLDGLGIIPKDGESKEEFLSRGNNILKVAETVSDRELINILTSVFRKKYEFSHPFFHSSFGKNYKRALHYIKQNYGMNLSWVRMLSMHPMELDPLDYVAAIALGVPVGKKFPVYVSVIAFFDYGYKKILHELLHCAGRHEEPDICYAERKEFTEKVANNGYHKSHLLSIGCSRLLWHTRRKLKKHFGTQSGYVFIRLEFDEIVELFAERSPHFTPVEWIKKRSARGSLRDKIMKEKLGL